MCTYPLECCSVVGVSLCETGHWVKQSWRGERCLAGCMDIVGTIPPAGTAAPLPSGTGLMTAAPRRHGTVPAGARTAAPPAVAAAAPRAAAPPAARPPVTQAAALRVAPGAGLGQSQQLKPAELSIEFPPAASFQARCAPNGLVVLLELASLHSLCCFTTE